MTRASGLQIDGHLVLVGLPGSGKSTVGRAVANRLSRPLLPLLLVFVMVTPPSPSPSPLFYH